MASQSFSPVHPNTVPLIVPGLNDSGPGHWQTWLQQRVTNARRVRQKDWQIPTLDAWARAVRDAALLTDLDTVLVAHSFGCLASVVAAAAIPSIKGLILVAPADPAKFGYADVFASARLRRPALLVGSQNDPWMTASRAEHYAALWGADYVCAGYAGHINVESGHGPWPLIGPLLGRFGLSGDFQN